MKENERKEKRKLKINERKKNKNIQRNIKMEKIKIK